MTISPFANESETEVISELTIENHVDRVVIYGDLEISKDKTGLSFARRLKILVDEIVQVLEEDENLPETLQTAQQQIDLIDNPFA
ncbi:MAG: hypothetical protein HQL95_07290 [Magnetococcales bacterium]|nr:hypothetical protein [Magnetococcales bacterium]